MPCLVSDLQVQKIHLQTEAGLGDYMCLQMSASVVPDWQHRHLFPFMAALTTVHQEKKRGPGPILHSVLTKLTYLCQHQDLGKGCYHPFLVLPPP